MNKINKSPKLCLKHGGLKCYGMLQPAAAYMTANSNKVHSELTTIKKKSTTSNRQTTTQKMKIGTKLLILLLTLNLLSCKSSVQKSDTQKPTPKFDFSGLETNSFPKPIGYINDYSQIFSEAQLSELEMILADYDAETTRQIAVVTIDSIDPYNDIHKYAVDLGQTWGVGSYEKNNGLIIVVCKPCRQIGIATGIGTELILTNDICKEVIDNIIIPELINENFYIGIKKGVTELIEKWN